MRLRRILFGIVATIGLVGAGGFAWTWRPAIAPIAIDDRPLKSRRAIQRGAELAAIGNCSDCHTMTSGEPYAGGRPLPTPFGTLFSSNITPDADTGIGTWSEAAFRRAMHDGVDREGRQLYPAFPYDHFTKATNEDINALYAFLMDQPPVRNAVPANELSFPFGFRPMLAGWKILFFRRGPLRPDASMSAEWNRGRYLAEGLAHCGGCHTPRNAMGAERTSLAYMGGVVEGWIAPSLASDSATQGWNADQLTQYLTTGWHPSRGAAAGPMTDVTNNLARVPPQDVRAIAVYIASLSERSRSIRSAAPRPRTSPLVGASPNTIAIYDGACANCHSDRRDVGPSRAISLSLSSAVRQSGSSNTVRVVLGGIQPRPGLSGPYMPSFDGILTDTQVESIVEYVRARYTSMPQWNDVQQEISKVRKGGAQP